MGSVGGAGRGVDRRRVEDGAGPPASPCAYGVRRGTAAGQVNTAGCQLKPGSAAHRAGGKRARRRRARSSAGPEDTEDVSMRQFRLMVAHDYPGLSL